MLDNTFKMPEYKEKVYELIPVDTYQAELEDISLVPNQFADEEDNKMQLKFTFRLLDEGKFYGRLMWMYGGLRLGGGSRPTNLYKIICGLTGITYDKEQCKTQDAWMTQEFMNGLLNTQVRLLIGQVERKDKTMANKVQNILPAKTELPKFDPSKMENPL